MIFIRFNPDNYRQNGKLKKTPLNKRFVFLKDKIAEVMDKIENDNGYDTWYTEHKLYFDE